MLQVNLNEINISFLECDNWLSYIFTIQGCRRWVGRVGNYPHPGFNRIGCCITIRLIQMQVQANLDLRTLIYSFLNRELFGLRKEIFLKSRFNCTTGSFINSNIN